VAAERSPKELRARSAAQADGDDLPALVTPNLSVRLCRRADRLVIALAGEFDSSDADAVDRLLVDVRAAGPRRIIVDLSELRFLGAYGVRALHHAADDVELVCPRGIVQRVLDLLGVTYVPDGTTRPTDAPTLRPDPSVRCNSSRRAVRDR
jgi:anti-anti-sigma factor